MSRPDPLADTPAYKCLVRAVAHSTIYTDYLKLSRVTFYILQRLLSSTPPQPSPLQSDGVLWELIKEGAVSPDWTEPS